MSALTDAREAAARQERWRNLAALAWVAATAVLVFVLLPPP